MHFFLLASVFLSELVILGQETAPDTFGGWITLINIGLAGVGLVAFVRGWIVPGVIYDQAVKREMARIEELKLLREVLDKEVIPELAKSRESTTEMLKLTEEFLKLIKSKE